MSNILTETMHAANSGMKSAKNETMHALETAKDGVQSAKKGTLHTVTSALSMITQGVAATAGIITTLQKLDRDDGLAWLGLSRRRSPLLTIAILGAGAALGAGIALWFAPMAGADLRNAVLGRTKDTAKKIETKVEDTAKKVDTKVEDTAKKVDTKVEGVVEHALKGVGADGVSHYGKSART